MTSFDQASGLVYHEQTVTLNKRKHALVRRKGDRDAVNECPPGLEWLHYCRGSTLIRPGTNPGPSTLQLLCLRSLCQNLNSIEDNALTTIPLSLLKWMWTLVKQSQLDTVRAWQLFAPLCAFETDTTKSVHMNEGWISPKVMHALSSPSFLWLTVVTLSNTSFENTSSTLSALGHLSNLMGLHLRQDRVPHATADTRNYVSVLNDRIFMIAGRQALENKAFPNLVGLFLQGKHQVTEATFGNLNNFPSLKIFGLLSHTDYFDPVSFKGYKGQVKLKAPIPAGWTEVTSQAMEVTSRNIGITSWIDQLCFHFAPKQSLLHSTKLRLHATVGCRSLGHEEMPRWGEYFQKTLTSPADSHGSAMQAQQMARVATGSKRPESRLEGSKRRIRQGKRIKLDDALFGS